MRIWFLLLLVFATPLVHAEMWKCVDSDGNIRYTNVKGDAKGCKGLNLEPLNTAPAPPRAAQQKPANFPSVDNDTQRSRDAGRRKILEQELALEQQQLEAAKKHTLLLTMISKIIFKVVEVTCANKMGNIISMQDSIVVLAYLA